MASKKVKAGETGFSYIDANGDLMMDAPVNEVQITSADDLAKLGEYLPGTVAYLPDLTGIWKKKADGTWGAIVAP